ncbi:hypothetical protein HYE82_17810 [Streptomyces sp. BR123]|uniref:hypothetical protein n=1 Tax=Streptomyces sp. BR123 TaxID=2749828 RepID=UPI0015C458C7|nr:hypothetical protein [Streptomyces sp. BR123]NXY96208.1 hypothetical protein [Streptomyces sp. BR123]
MITRLVDGRICTYEPAGDTWGVLQPTAAFRPVAGHEVVAAAVAADLQRAFCTTRNALVCAADTGEVVWRASLEPHWERPYVHRPGCVLSSDGRVMWSTG